MIQGFRRYIRRRSRGSSGVPTGWPQQRLSDLNRRNFASLPPDRPRDVQQSARQQQISNHSQPQKRMMELVLVRHAESAPLFKRQQERNKGAGCCLLCATLGCNIS